MALSKEQIQSLLHFVAGTCDMAMSCDDCLADLAEFAENELQGRDKCQAMQAIQVHLDFCPECVEEFELLMEALKSVEGG